MNADFEPSSLKTIKDPFLGVLSKGIVFFLKLLMILLAFVIFWSVIDVGVHLYQQNFPVFGTDNLIDILAAFLAPIIAIEVFLSILFFVENGEINVPLILASALTALSRKVIILDYTKADAIQIAAIALLVLCLGAAFKFTQKMPALK